MFPTSTLVNCHLHQIVSRVNVNVCFSIFCHRPSEQCEPLQCWLFLSTDCTLFACLLCVNLLGQCLQFCAPEVFVLAFTSYFSSDCCEKNSLLYCWLFITAGPCTVLKWRSADGFVISENCKTTRLHKTCLVQGLAESHAYTYRSRILYRNHVGW